MTLTDVLKDFAYISVLLLIGFELRKHVRILQKYFIPTSLIAGTLGMFFGPSWLGTVSSICIPFSKSLSQWSGVLVIFVCATMFLGLELGKVGRDGMATTFIAGTVHQSQLLIGLGVAAVFGLFTALPYQFGYMGVWGFYAGHGNATTVGNIIKEAGYWNDAVGVGVTFATIGIICGIVGGMILINIGAKKGLTHVKMTFDMMPEEERTGYIAPEKRVSIGNAVTSASSLDPLAFQLAIVGIVIVLGVAEHALLVSISPAMKGFPLVGAVLISSMVVGFIINRTKLKRRIDRKLMSRITGTALEYMITAAIVTTSKQIFLNYALPLTIISALMVLGNIFFCFFLGKRWLKESWFETAVGLYGQCCGILATGLMLIKVMDPSSETISSQCISTSSTLGYSWQIPYMIIGSIAIFTAPIPTTIVTFAFFLFCLIGGECLYGKKRKRNVA
jgi:ESS family glutamate:Na+ symporter